MWESYFAAPILLGLPLYGHGEEIIKMGSTKEYNRIYYEKNKEVCKERAKKYYEKNKDKHKEYYEKNRGKHTEYYEKNREKILAYQRKKYEEKSKEEKEEYLTKKRKQDKKWFASPASFTSYKNKLTVDEDPIDDGAGNLLVLCTYCGKRFNPTNVMSRDRASALIGKTRGECRLYCSEGCKIACPVYHKHSWPKGFKPASSREVDPLFRKMVLELDNWECQRCGNTTEEASLHVHHIQGATLYPMISNDVDNGITYCKPCHKWVHSVKGCRYIDLRRGECNPQEEADKFPIKKEAYA